VPRGQEIVGNDGKTGSVAQVGGFHPRLSARIGGTALSLPRSGYTTPPGVAQRTPGTPTATITIPYPEGVAQDPAALVEPLQGSRAW